MNHQKASAAIDRIREIAGNKLAGDLPLVEQKIKIGPCKCGKHEALERAKNEYGIEPSAK